MRTVVLSRVESQSADKSAQCIGDNNNVTMAVDAS